MDKLKALWDKAKAFWEWTKANRKYLIAWALIGVIVGIWVGSCVG